MKLKQKKVEQKKEKKWRLNEFNEQRNVDLSKTVEKLTPSRRNKKMLADVEDNTDT